MSVYAFVLAISLAIRSVHSRTWGRMYYRNALLFHLPSITILSSLWFFMKRAIAAPDQMDLVPKSFGSNL